MATVIGRAGRSQPKTHHNRQARSSFGRLGALADGRGRVVATRRGALANGYGHCISRHGAIANSYAGALGRRTQSLAVARIVVDLDKRSPASPRARAPFLFTQHVSQVSQLSGEQLSGEKDLIKA